MTHTTALPGMRSNGSFWVVPYVRGRLVFAAMAARALQERAFETVLIDLPCFMNQRRWLDAPLAAFPLVSSLLVNGDDGTCSLYPLAPTDAACAAAWLARNRSLAFECVDPAIFSGSCDGIHTIPTPAPGDERIALRKGLESYFEGAWLELDALSQEAPDASMKSLIARGEAVADRISDRFAAGRELLFVCEYRLWWAVRRALELRPGGREETSRDVEGGRTRSCALLLEDPYLLWAAGLFDDYLTVNRRFHESLESGSAASFDKFAVMTGLAAGCSNRELAARIRHASPDTPAALVRGVQDETGPGPAALDELAHLLLDYPVPTAVDAARHPPEYFEIAGDSIAPGDKCFDLPDVFHIRPYGEPRLSEAEHASPAAGDFNPAPWLHYVHPVITRQEAKDLGERTSDSRWAVARDFELHTQACCLVRQAVTRTGHAAPEDEQLGTYTPAVFVFCKDDGEPWKFTLVHNNNLSWQEIELRSQGHRPLEDKPARDYVYSLFATTRTLEPLFETHIERELITSLTLLFSGRGMGVDRYGAITRQPKKYQCRIGPKDDPDLRNFKSHDLGLAWALKYARKNVVVASCPGWEPSQAVREFAGQQSKRILTVPLDVLPGRLAERLSRLHFISHSLKAHPECERIVARFVP